MRHSIRLLRNMGLSDETVIAIADDMLEKYDCISPQDIKYLVLVAEVGADAVDADEWGCDNCIFSVGSFEYLVLTENELEELWHNVLEDYLDECVAGSSSPYFDREAWKRDAYADGPAHRLGVRNGVEYTRAVGCEIYTVYQVD